ncbi:hypothetical protein RHGRI_035548 [Rhododendron griersonianum]|uniref:Uncharacterized protein n=1 Tax=Rhododendron griersonianum TaxID=479676 RepID=A0AAV6HJM5_9ERIC|nr:hypothetical protein RHGRI_035548 [Rhododendron griersonianum]
MEGLSASLYKGVKGYWRRRKYERLNGATRRRKVTVVQVGRGGGGGSNRRRRFWKIKITPKLRFSPKKFLIGLRDAYVNFMLRIADASPAFSGGYDGVFDNSFGKGPLKEYDKKMIAQIYGGGPVTEYDDKMIGQIYKSLVVAQGQLVPRDAGRIGKQIVCGK